MNKDEMLKRKDKKEWFACVLLGFFIGLAVVIPGISGATIAIIFGLHSKLLYAFENFFKKFKKAVVFLIPIMLGTGAGFLFGFLVVQKVFNLAPFIIVCLFAGLMIGSFPAVKDEIKGVKFTTGKTILFVLGVIIPIVIGVLSICLNTGSTGPLNANWTLVIVYFVMGFFLSLTQLIPGLSCSAILMALGQYGAILASVRLDYLFANPMVIITLISLAIGFFAGTGAFSALINRLLDKKRDYTYSAIVGLSLGSIASMFINPEVWAVYTSWNSFGSVAFDIGLGLALLVVGILITYPLVKYQRKKNLENKNLQNNK